MKMSCAKGIKVSSQSLRIRIMKLMPKMLSFFSANDIYNIFLTITFILRKLYRLKTFYFLILILYECKICIYAYKFTEVKPISANK